jgi:hypothetical protein
MWARTSRATGAPVGVGSKAIFPVGTRWAKAYTIGPWLSLKRRGRVSGILTKAGEKRHAKGSTPRDSARNSPARVLCLLLFLNGTGAHCNDRSAHAL